MAEERRDSMLTLLVGRYPSVEAAIEDFDYVREDRAEHFSTVFDAAVVEHDDDGRIRVARKHETPARMGGWAGFVAGAALAAIFPPALLTVPAAAGIGAIAGHFTRGMSRADIREIGEMLEECQAALVIVIASGYADSVRERMGRAEHIECRDIAASAREIDRALDDMASSDPAVRDSDC